MNKRCINLITPSINSRSVICTSLTTFREAISGKKVGNILALAFDEKLGEIHVVLADRAVKIEDKRGMPKAGILGLTPFSLVENDASTGAFNASTEEFGPLAQKVVDTIRNEVLAPANTRSLMLVTDGRLTKNWIGFETTKAVCTDALGVSYTKLPTIAPCFLGAKDKALVTLSIESLRVGKQTEWRTVATFKENIVDLPVVRHRFDNAFISTEKTLEAVDLTTLASGKATIITSEKYPANFKVKVVGEIDADTVLAYAWGNDTGIGRYLTVTTPRSSTAPHCLAAINEAAQLAFGAQ